MKIFQRMIALALLCGAGCGSAGEFSWVTHTWTTEDGVFAMDHISRRLVDVTTAVRRPYLGETYYFESEEHARIFDGNPWAYLYNDNVHASTRPDRTDQN